MNTAMRTVIVSFILFVTIGAISAQTVNRSLDIYVNKWEGMGKREACANISAPGNQLYVTVAPNWTSKICRGGESNVCTWSFAFTTYTSEQICAVATCTDSTVENCAGAISVGIAETTPNRSIAKEQTTSAKLAHPLNPTVTVCAHPDFDGEKMLFKSWEIVPVRKSKYDPYNCVYYGVVDRANDGPPCVRFSAQTSKLNMSYECAGDVSLTVNLYPSK